MKILYFVFIVVFSISTFAKAPFSNPKILKNPPPRIIRTCCSFGVDVKIAGLPFFKLTEITEINKIGPHVYLGSKKEHNGIIYTQKGGFIDMGHLRDIADFTGYLFNIIQKVKSQKSFTIKLGNEAGMKSLTVTVPEDISEIDAVNLAGKIAYDISVWHEISTWFGASFIPLVPERYSSFSIEDAYSNLMGVHLGMKAILSELDFEEAMTKFEMETLISLNAVKDAAGTYEAMNKVRDIWWSGTAKLPSRKVIIKRQFEVYGCMFPLLIDNLSLEKTNDNQICVPATTVSGSNLNDYYLLGIKYNFKIPVKKIFGEDKKDKNLTQLDFPDLIKYSEKMAQKGLIR
jgi:hypothetical protein